MKEYTLTPAAFLGKTHETDSIVSFYFEKPDGYTFEAGQSTKLCLNGDPGDKEMARTMSFCSAPSESELMFTMHIDSGSVFKTKLLELKPGDVVDLRNPRGEFVLPERFSKLYFIAGGVGITPFMSMFRELEINESELLKNIAFYHVSSGKFIFEEEYSKLPIHSAAANFDEMRSQLEAHQEHLSSCGNLFYISGSPRFVIGVRKILQGIGVDKEKIKLDSFAGYKEMQL